MTPDCYFKIGSSHDVCQDYARTWTTSNGICAAIADGCSSVEHSDCDARDAVKWMMDKTCHENTDYGEFSGTTKAMATLGLCKEFDYKFSVLLYGDGTVCGISADGKIINAITVEFASNAPKYIGYSGDGLERYMREFGESEYTVTETVNGEEVAKETKLVRDYSPLEWKVPQYLDTVAVLSDGISSFYRKSPTGNKEPVPPFEILKECLAFKNFKGDFVKRRCRRMFQDFAKLGIEHSDDFSMAAITRL